MNFFHIMVRRTENKKGKHIILFSFLSVFYANTFKRLFFSVCKQLNFALYTLLMGALCS